MKHTWRCDFSNGDYIEYSTGKMQLDILFEEFRNYLQGCGFCFKLSEEIQLVDTNELEDSKDE